MQELDRIAKLVSRLTNICACVKNNEMNENIIIPLCLFHHCLIFCFENHQLYLVCWAEVVVLDVSW